MAKFKLTMFADDKKALSETMFSLKGHFSYLSDAPGIYIGVNTKGQYVVDPTTNKNITVSLGFGEGFDNSTKVAHHTIDLKIISTKGKATAGNDIIVAHKTNGGVYSAGDGNDTMYGRGIKVTFEGGKGSDKLYGSEGNDKLYGDGAFGSLKHITTNNHDKLFGRGGNDDMEGGNGNDLLDGGKGNDTLKGETGKDKLLGGAGDDILNGGQGPDDMTGGSGHDTFQYWFASESGPSAATRDVIHDLFKGDTIDLSRIVKGKFDFIGREEFDGPNEVRYEHTKGGNTLIQVNTDSDHSAEMSILAMGKIYLTDDYFIL